MTFPVTKKMRAARRALAEERQKLYNDLTLQQKLDGVPGRHAPAGKKVRAKLELQVAKLADKAEKAKQVAAVVAAKEISQKKNK